MDIVKLHGGGHNGNNYYVCEGHYFVNLYGTAALVSATQKIVTVTVLADEVWQVTGGYLLNGDSVVRDCKVYHYFADGEMIDCLLYHAALGVAARAFFPNSMTAGNDTYTHGSAYPLVMTALSYISFVWEAGAASAGGTGKYVLKYRKIN